MSNRRIRGEPMKNQPIFKNIFAAHWGSLAPVLQRRYANRPDCLDEVVVDGTLDIHVSTWMKILSPVMRLCGALLPYGGKNIPVTVCFNSQQGTNAITFNRTFHFAKQGPYRFRSKLVPMGGNNVVEFMRFGLGWRMKYYIDGQKVILAHDGYIWRIFGMSIPLPFQFILGRGHAEEQAVSDDEFVMCFKIIHPWFGNVFGYEGKFTLTAWPQ